jgi:hypothetical protein
VIVPKTLEIQHMNRHGYTSQNVMAICDFDLRFTFVVDGWPGSVHDTRVWSDAQVAYPHYPHPPTGNLLCRHFLKCFLISNILSKFFFISPQENITLWIRDTRTEMDI